MQIVIAGNNEIAFNIAEMLSHEYSITLVGPTEQDFHHLEGNERVRLVTGDILDLEVLNRADVPDCDVFVASTDIDDRNLVACLTAKSLFRIQAEEDSKRSLERMDEQHIICLLNQPNYSGVKSYDEQLARSLGIDAVVRPSEELASEICDIANFPGALDVKIFEEEAIILRAEVEEGAAVIGVPLCELKFPNDVLVVSCKRGEDPPFLPSGKTMLEAKDKVTVIGFSKQLREFLKNYLQVVDHDKEVKKATIIGGGSAGSNVAMKLYESGWAVEVIESNPDVVNSLASEGTFLVHQGDGTDFVSLQEFSVQNSSLVVVVTNSDENNFLASVLAQYLGVERIITRANRLVNEELFENLGIDVVLSARGAAIRKMVHQVIEKSPVRAELEHGVFQTIEIELNKTFRPRPIYECNLSKDALIGVIVRGRKILIATGTSELLPKDRILIIVRRDSAEDIRNHFNDMCFEDDRE